MDPQVEISRIKRRRMGLLALAALAALAGYFLWRGWSFTLWHEGLVEGLPARQEERALAQERFFSAACAGLSEEPARGRVPVLPESLHEIVGGSSRAFEQRAALLRFKSQLLASLDPGKIQSKISSALVPAPTFYLREFFDPLVGLGAWQFTRHLFDARGKLLLDYPATGSYENVLDNPQHVRAQLGLYDYVLSLDLPETSAPCEEVFGAAIARDFAARVVTDIETAAGGPLRWLALRSEGRAEPLLAALAMERIGQVELVGEVATKDQQRLALALSLLGDRYLIVEKRSLGENALAELRAALELLGQAGNLEVR